jgi:hypothetical protein
MKPNLIGSRIDHYKSAVLKRRRKSPFLRPEDKL